MGLHIIWYNTPYLRLLNVFIEHTINLIHIQIWFSYYTMWEQWPEAEKICPTVIPVEGGGLLLIYSHWKTYRKKYATARFDIFWNLKIPKWQPEVIIRRTDVYNNQQKKRQTIYKTLHKKNTEQHEHNKTKLMKTTTTKSKKQIKRRMGWLQIVTSFQINQMKVSIFAVCAYSSFHLKTTLGGLHILTTSSVTLLCVWIRNNISPDSGCLSKLLIPRNFLSMTWHFHEYYDEDKQNHINHTVLYFRNIIRRKSTMDNYLSNVEKSIRYI